MRKFFKQYIPYYKNYKLEFFYTIVGVILVAVATSGTAYAIQPLLDDIFIKKDQEMLYIMPIFVIILYTAKGFGGYIQAYFISFIGQDITRIVRDKLFSHILTLDMDFFQKIHGGELVSRITNDINRIQRAISNNLAEILRESLTIVGLIGLVIYHSPELAFYGLIVLPLAVYPLSLLAKKMKKLSFKSQESNSDITSSLNESFNNIEIIKANSTEKVEVTKFSVHNMLFFKYNMKAVKTNQLTSPLMEIIGAFAFAAVIIVGGSKVISGELTTGEFSSFIAALFMLYTPIKKISNLYNGMQDAIAANERINDMFSKRPSIISGEIKEIEDIKEIHFKNVELKYDNFVALKNINLDAKKGETIALVGDSGGGKSSLINLIVRFYDTTNGEILINNNSVKDLDLKSLRENISIVTQRVYIFNDTIAANIAYGYEIDEIKVIEVLKQAHAYDFVMQMKKGIHTILDEFGTNLSGGQRQRIAIARALYKNPKILILDEATSALDNKSESIISEVINEVSRDKITFIIAHRLSTIKNASKIAVFKSGEIISIGTEQELKSNCEEYQRLSSSANI
ncbi:ABC transporter ATP-binding protein [Aliarcobacter butzleri]|uniref:ABC transporter ATP-binding protein n=1 Tax=Aliarcobacter butzleri TaxID=28197 RepID=UPI00125F6395|nr:ABC transporter ATP-binding protein [Aliarcobacter butzleri]MCT7549436.1 ABC transporter ATP-binding protein/permease [Aliarcobacter butzleri]MCT7558238.1 ABC transporter ATP-binding protein/permease [Aliarcobacter butzleri]MCT7625395.1 ABC transporter ATP-binding protein/permease [Aliarcobacter butzleri]MCT7635977.1 ABC transporter ATP-binding protein/permease [Aliarcobacter butzleri]MCT7642439.1 ABC transporter ATP-binding protein/permease [Aliarcobacter butzleri]